jgi:tellurite resistance protein TerC
MDNIFVIAMIFSFFGVPDRYQHRVLFWGVLGALVLRGVMIGAGAVLIQRFSWMTYVLGAILILTALRMAVSHHEDIHPDQNPLVRLARRFYPVSSDFEGEKLFTQLNGRRAMTPLMVVLLVVESSDVVFAVDSIPAIFAITTDPFLVFTSNALAILGLRSLYFALAGMIRKFYYLKISLVAILGYVGVKMILAHHLHIPTLATLAVIVATLAIGILASLLVKRGEGAAEA